MCLYKISFLLKWPWFLRLPKETDKHKNKCLTGWTSFFKSVIYLINFSLCGNSFASSIPSLLFVWFYGKNWFSCLRWSVLSVQVWFNFCTPSPSYLSECMGCKRLDARRLCYLGQHFMTKNLEVLHDFSKVIVGLHLILNF